MGVDWIELAVAADDEAVDTVAEVLRNVGHGVAIDQPFVQLSLDDPPQRDPTRRPVVKTYIPDDAAARETQHRIEQSLWHIGRLGTVEPLRVRRIVTEDWEQAWKPHFPVVHIGLRTVIVPAWRRYRARAGESVLRLDPGLAFGTGLHPTTRLCLTAIESLVAPGARVLDAGTGSGILAIAAARMGAARVFALDVDPIAVSAARQNVRLNSLSRVIRVYEGPADGLLASRAGPAVPARGRAAGPKARPASPIAGPFDLIVANLTAKVNVSLAPVLAPLLAPDGRLVASGILAERAGEVVGALVAAGLEVVERQHETDWVALVAQRGGAGAP
ncbi:MAG: methyltransferase [Chloroflexi bacterium]|nr:methyltransferase [Chloroflexota bacterium]